MGTDVGSPDVVFGIDANHVRRHEQVVGNAPDELTRSIEFHERMLPPMKEVDVSFRIHGDASRFDQMLFCRNPEEVRNGVVIHFR